MHVSRAGGSKTIDWYRFLDRPRLPTPAPDALAPLRGAAILITGAGGSIGSALSLRLAAMRPRELVLLDSSEQALHQLQLALGEAGVSSGPRLLLGNVGDGALLEEVFDLYRPQFVFHAAAYKHVPILEEHPLEAIRNNALHANLLASFACRSREVRMVLLSTDKAVEPVNILGASKRIAEEVTVAHGGVVLRLGNVLETAGSVSEIFMNQIASGGPITLTDLEAKRYFLTREEAVDLLLRCSVDADDGAVLAPDLDRQYGIASLADFLVETQALGQAISIQIVGSRAGDKSCEALWSRRERAIRLEDRGYVSIVPQTGESSRLGDGEQADLLNALRLAVGKRDVAAAIALVRRLVPEYRPSEAIGFDLRASGTGVVPA